MPVWEYKIISSGKGGFASPVLLEKFLGDLGRDEWEIIQYQALPDNPLAFSGLARRPTQRDWTLQDAVAAAAKAEAEKLRAEFEAKFKGAVAGGGGEEPPAPFLEEKVAPDDGFRKPVDTSRDSDPEAEEETKADDWDKLTAAEEDELPTFFEAIRPHMRRNQRGPGMSVGVDYLAKKWDISEDDIKGALVECGFVIPEDEDSKPEYLEYDGDLFWLNENRRGELWINTKEKPRPIFRSVKAERIIVEGQPDSGGQTTEGGAQTTDGGVSSVGLAKEEGQTAENRSQESEARSQEGRERKHGRDRADRKSNRHQQPEAPNSELQTAPAGAGATLPEGLALLERIKPLMRRNRRGAGGSGSTSFLSRALKCSEADLKAAFVALGLAAPASPSDKPVYLEIGNLQWWLNQDSRGGWWINGNEKSEVAEQTAEDRGQRTEDGASSEGLAKEEGRTTDGGQQASEDGQKTTDNVLSAVRGQLKPGKGGAVAAQVEELATAAGKGVDEFVAGLVATGLKVPEKPRERPAYVDVAGEAFWLSRNAKGELSLNARPAKSAGKKGDGEEAVTEGGDGEGANKARRSRGRKKEEPV